MAEAQLVPDTNPSTATAESPEIAYSDLYDKLQQRFDVSYEISQKLFKEEQYQRQTLAYFQRRNNALLDMISKVEPQPSHEVTVDRARIEQIIGKSARLEKILTPLLDLNDDTEVNKLHYINLYLSESVPELVNDDITTIEVNPQQPECWIQRNGGDYVATDFQQVEIPATGLVLAYVGTDGPVAEEETAVVKPAKKKRKPAEPSKKKKTN